MILAQYLFKKIIKYYILHASCSGNQTVTEEQVLQFDFSVFVCISG